MKLFNFFIAFIFASVILSSCGTKEKGSPEYIQSIKQWRFERTNNLKKADGWLTLEGLHWLKRGENAFGTSDSNDIVFPENSIPKFTGKFIFDGDSVIAEIAPQVEVFLKNGKPVKRVKLVSDAKGKQTILSYGSYSWYLIIRGGRYGIRIKNAESPLRKSFSGIETYPINEEWRLKARVKYYKFPKLITIPSVIGTVEEDSTEFYLEFEKNGKIFTLDPIEEGDGLFIIFADETSGVETYGAGRFLYVDKPNENGETIIDFNKAYNPPCAFTKYATCPLPPKDNFLKLRIAAGEKDFHGYEH